MMVYPPGSLAREEDGADCIHTSRRFLHYPLPCCASIELTNSPSDANTYL